MLTNIKNFKGVLIHFLLIFLTYIPFLIFSLIEVSKGVSSDTLIQYVQSNIGILGLLLMLWQVTLGVRSIATIFTKDIIWLNSIHSFFGKYGFVLIMLHPILYYYRRLIDVGAISLPNLSLVRDQYIFLGQLAIFLLGSLWVTSAIFRNKLPYRLWKFIHFVSYPIIFLVFIHSLNIGVILNTPRSDVLRYVWIILFIIFILASIYRLIFQIGILKYKYVVSGVTKVALDTSKIDLKPINKVLNINPSQFLYIQNNIFDEAHPYTISHKNMESNEISITVKNLGKHSEYLNELRIGHKIYLDGPYGVFMQDKSLLDKYPLVLLAGGIGITPFVDYINSLKTKELNHDVILFFGAKTIDDLAFKSDFDEVSRLNPRFKVIYVLSDVKESISGFETGYITEELIKRYITEFNNRKYFVCGPTLMLEKVEEILKSNNVSIDDIYSEKFSF